MHLDDRAADRNRFDFEANDLFLLESGKDTVEYAVFRLAAHPRVNCVPVAESLWQRAPLATVFRHVKNRVDDLKVGDIENASW